MKRALIAATLAFTLVAASPPPTDAPDASVSDDFGDDLEIPGVSDPSTHQECRAREWGLLTFRNVGQCIRFVNRGYP
jgi:hypothetical protein